MTYMVGTSDNTEHNWMIANRFSGGFIDLVCSELSHDPDLVKIVSVSHAFNGISLDGIYSDKPNSALQIANAMIKVCCLFIDKKVDWVNDANAPNLDVHFVCLKAILQRFIDRNRG